MSALLGALSLSTDAANGVRPQTALRTAVIAADIARALGLDPAEAHAAYWAAMLRYLGCTSFAHETAALAAGDDLALLGALQTVDGARARSVLDRALHATKGRALFDRAAALTRLVSQPDAGRSLAAAHCAQAESLAALLGATEGVRAALADLYERYDGLGNPSQKRGDAIAMAARVVHVAAWAEAHANVGGVSHAVTMVDAMRARALDPTVCDALISCAPTVFASLERRVYERAIEVEPEPRWQCDPSQRESVFVAFARYADLKSPFTLSHSTAVAALVDRACAAMGLSDLERARARHAALVHDIGRVAVSNGVWDSREPLGALEWEQIRSHAGHTHRVLSFFEHTRGLADIAASAHERSDESGYPARRAPTTVAARVLEACDVAVALGEARPHRPAMSPSAKREHLQDESKRGSLDRAAVECVLALLDGRSLAPAVAPSALSEREIAVLALLARGASNKEIAAELGISPKTVQHHVAHVYEKTGVRSRAAAALYAVERGWAGARANAEPSG